MLNYRCHICCFSTGSGSLERCVEDLVTAVLSLHCRVEKAYGATREAIFAALFRQGARLVIGGLILGLFAGIWPRRVVATFVFGITAGDPPTYAAASVAFLLIALAAIAIPAIRAARVEPIMALRDE